MTRFQYLDFLLSTITSKALEEIHFVTVMISDEDYIELKNGGKVRLEFGTKEQPYLQEWVGPEMGLWSFLIYSQEMQKRYEDGDEKAIFEFCRRTAFPFRANWLLSQIEKWRLENTRNSISKIRRLFNGYIYARGKSGREIMTELLLRDWKIFRHIAILENKGIINKIALHQASRKFNVSFESAREIYFEFKKFNERVRILRSNYRGIAIGFPKEMPEVEEIDPLLETLFNMRSFVKGIDLEVQIYRCIRMLMGNLAYEEGISVVRIINPTYRKMSLKEAINIISKKFHVSPLHLTDLYGDLLTWEILRNNDNKDIIEGLPSCPTTS